MKINRHILATLNHNLKFTFVYNVAFSEKEIASTIWRQHIMLITAQIVFEETFGSYKNLQMKNNYEKTRNYVIETKI